MDLAPLQLWERAGVGSIWGAPMHVCIHVHTHVHVKHAKHDTHEGGHLQFLYMYILG